MGPPSQMYCKDFCDTAWFSSRVFTDLSPSLCLLSFPWQDELSQKAPMFGLTAHHVVLVVQSPFDRLSPEGSSCVSFLIIALLSGQSKAFNKVCKKYLQ